MKRRAFPAKESRQALAGRTFRSTGLALSAARARKISRWSKSRSKEGAGVELAARVFDQSDTPFPDRHAEYGRSVLLEDTDLHLRAQRPGRARTGRQQADRYDAAGAVRAAFAEAQGPRAARCADLLRRTGSDRSRLRAACAGRRVAIDAARARCDRADDLEGHPGSGRARRRPAEDPGDARLCRMVRGPDRARAV